MQSCSQSCSSSCSQKWMFPELSFSDRWSRRTKLWERDRAKCWLTNSTSVIFLFHRGVLNYFKSYLFFFVGKPDRADLTDDNIVNVSKTKHLRCCYYCLTVIPSHVPKEKRKMLTTFKAVSLSLCILFGVWRTQRKISSYQDHIWLTWDKPMLVPACLSHFSLKLFFRWRGKGTH